MKTNIYWYINSLKAPLRCFLKAVYGPFKGTRNALRFISNLGPERVAVLVATARVRAMLPWFSTSWGHAAIASSCLSTAVCMHVCMHVVWDNYWWWLWGQPSNAGQDLAGSMHIPQHAGVIFIASLPPFSCEAWHLLPAGYVDIVSVDNF